MAKDDSAFKMMDLRHLGEFGLIHHLHARLRQRAGVQLGIGDDAAVLQLLQAPLVTCDCLVEGVHFRRDWATPRQLGRKSMAVNVSDIAAMGGRPVAAFVSLALGPHDDLGFIEELYAGMEEVAAQDGFTIAGGDISRSLGAMMLSITLVGESPLLDGEAQALLRRGAVPGDVVLVTGSLGDAAAGLALLQSPQVDVPPQARRYLLDRHREPTARLAEAHAALAVAGTSGRAATNAVSPVAAHRALHAGLDISDGVAGDAAHIARASNVTVEIEAAGLPLTEACRQAAAALGADAWQWALSGGEDYELLWCVEADSAAAVIEAVRAQTGTAVTAIGRCAVAGKDSVIIINPDGHKATGVNAFQHF